jgi:hypothetical protein
VTHALQEILQHRNCLHVSKQAALSGDYGVTHNPTPILIK